MFGARRQAVSCVRQLVHHGFDRADVGFAGPGVAEALPLEGEDDDPGGPIAATAAGSVAGGVVGGVLGGVVAGLVPGLGPVVAGGVLAGVVAGAPAGAAIGGLAAVLREAGLAPGVARFYEDQVHSGRFLVTVSDPRADEASRIMAECGGSIEGSVSRVVSRLTGTPPDLPESVEGRFADADFADVAARRLSAAYPDREVSVDRRERRVTARRRP